MRRVVYVDTGAWIALLWRRDRDHRAVANHFRRLRASGDLLVTSEPVIGETATRLRYDAGLDAALTFHRLLEDAALGSDIRIRDTDPALRRGAFEIMAQYADLRLSYADSVGAVVASEVGAQVVLGLDHDFRVLGFTVEP